MTAPCPTFGFVVELQFRRELTDTATGRFWADWRSFLHSLGLRESRRGPVVVVMGEGTQATDSDRVGAETWLAGRPELVAWRVSELGDVQQSV